MLTFSSESDNPLIGCGIDSEKIERFAKYIEKKNPLPHVFSKREVAHIHTLEDKALGFCASFCCKEAFYKAVDQPFSFPDSEFFYLPNGQPDLRFSLPQQFTESLAECRIKLFHHTQDEVMALIYLFGLEK